MNILILSSDMNVESKANRNIALSLASSFSNFGHNVEYISFEDVKTVEKKTRENLTITEYPITEEYLNIFDKKEKCKNGKNKFISVLFHPFVIIEYIYRKKKVLNDEINYIIESIKANRIDYIICLYYPFNETIKTIRKIKHIKIIPYQLDPWGLHELMNKYTKIFRILQEKYVFNRASLIVTTNVLVKQYRENKYYKKYVNKMIALNFPILEEKEDSESELFDKKYINIAFFGIINDLYRNPRKIIEDLYDINNNYGMNIKMHFFGINQSKALLHLKDNYKEFIELHGVVDEKTSKMLMNNKIILLNINNTSTNQVPSKIVDYISTGNPVINVIKNVNDSSIDIFKKYKYVFNYCEYNNDNTEELHNFIINNVDKKEEFKTIKSKYIEFTPDYVVKAIIEKL